MTASTATAAPAPSAGAPPSPLTGGAVSAVERLPLRRQLAAAWSRTAAARSAAARVLRTVTPFGWLAAVIAVGCGWVAWRFAWVETAVLALAAGLCLLVAVGFVLGRSTYAVRVELASARVVVGTRANGQVEVTNSGPRTMLPARIELPVGRGLAAFRLPRLAKGASHEELFVVPTSRRGVIVVGPVLSVRDDPLRLLRREVRWTDAQDLFVHPLTVSLDGASSGFLRDIEGLPTKDLSSSDVSFHALREYAPGDDRRSIHWRTTARTGRLMVRQYEETRRSHLVVALSVNPADYADPEEFELAVSCAGSLGLQAVREEKQVTLLTQVGVLGSATGQRLLDSLSAVELVSGPGVDALSRAAAHQVPGASAVAVLAGSTVTPSDWQRAGRHVPLGAAGFSVACDLGVDVTRRTIGSFAVIGLGRLADLPRVMRRLEG